MPLTAGQRLSRDEFLRRWEAMPDFKFAELIGGIVYLPSPVGLPHSRLTTKTATLLSCYAAATKGCDAACDATWYLLDDAPQPDVALFVLPEYGGRCHYVDNYIGGPPELVVEVSASTKAVDFGPKLRL
ncbi:MAG: Uma2 family endonuclease, partial [Bryobacteraceae bacterium]|nr:Uma2 family endonuclease [Bryobacteraceae bacterium]